MLKYKIPQIVTLTPCFNLIKFCQMEIEHDPATSDLKDFVLDDL